MIACYMYYTINQNGIDQIASFLAENHTVGSFSKGALNVWAREAEKSLSEGNGALIEVCGTYSVTGNPICFTVSPEGIDAVLFSEDEDEDEDDDE